MIRICRPFIAAAVALLLTSALLPNFAKGQEQEPDVPHRVSYAAGEHPVSPKVWASWIAETEEGTRPEVVLVVLWRGAPLWYSQICGGTTIMPPPGRTSEPLESSFRFGDTELRLSYIPSARVVGLLDQEIVLGEDNVVFVDQVGLPGVAPHFSGTARVDLQLEWSALDPQGTPNQLITEILRRSPEVQSFLR